MESFVHHIPTKVYFGQDQLGHVGEELKTFGNRVLLVYGGGSIKRSGLYDKLMAGMKEAGLEVFELSGIEPNPRIESVRKGAELCKEKNIDVVFAVGGGSTIDASKFIAAGACTDIDPWDFFSKHVPIEQALPLVTILTLSATGSEMNCGGVVTNLSTNEKLGYGAECLRPKVSFLDPTLTFTVSPYQTACGSADILSHVMEVYFNMNHEMYLQDSFMEGLMKTVIRYAPIAMTDPENYEARANLMWASSWAINDFVEEGRDLAWSCHPMEHELSAFYDITHGLGLAMLTPRWMRYCLDETTVSKYVQFGTSVFGIDRNQEPMAIAEQAISKLEDFFFRTLGLDDTFTKVGIGEDKIEVMAEKACRGGVLQGFKPLSAKDIEKIYRMCL